MSRLDVQGAINAQILTRLEQLGKRLEKIEEKSYKKTSDKSKVKSSKKSSEIAKKSLVKNQNQIRHSPPFPVQLLSP